MSRDGYDIGSAAGSLWNAVTQLNEAVEKAKAQGWSVNLSVNGLEYGDCVDLRLEREDYFAALRKAALVAPSQTNSPPAASETPTTT